MEPEGQPRFLRIVAVVCGLAASASSCSLSDGEYQAESATTVAQTTVVEVKLAPQSELEPLDSVPGISPPIDAEYVNQSSTTFVPVDGGPPTEPANYVLDVQSLKEPKSEDEKGLLDVGIDLIRRDRRPFRAGRTPERAREVDALYIEKSRERMKFFEEGPPSKDNVRMLPGRLDRVRIESIEPQADGSIRFKICITTNGLPYRDDGNDGTWTVGGPYVDSGEGYYDIKRVDGTWSIAKQGFLTNLWGDQCPK